MTCAPFMTSREAVLKDVMLSTALLSPIRVNIVDDIPETETGKLAISFYDSIDETSDLLGLLKEKRKLDLVKILNLEAVVKTLNSVEEH